jgi:hypothetical protein
MGICLLLALGGCATTPPRPAKTAKIDVAKDTRASTTKDPTVEAKQPGEVSPPAPAPETTPPAPPASPAQ